MAVLNSNKANVAFKNLLNKSQTDSGKELGNEGEGIFFNIPGAGIWLDLIDPNPATSIAAGVSISVTAELELDVTSNGHAYFAQWPGSPPSGTDPITAASYTYGAGLLVDVTAGDRITNAIYPGFGFQYESKPYAGAALISPGDARNWVYQYNSGIFWQQDNVGSTPTTIQIYAYSGETLSSGSDNATVQKMSIDDKGWVGLDTFADGDPVSVSTLSNTPVDGSYVEVRVNGVDYEVGDGVDTKSCFFADPFGSPLLPRGFSSAHANGQVQIGDKLYWNGSVSLLEIITGWRVSIHYLV